MKTASIKTLLATILLMAFLTATCIILPGCGSSHRDTNNSSTHIRRPSHTKGRAANIRIAVGGVQDKTGKDRLALSPFLEHRLEAVLSYERGFSLCTRNTMDEIKKEDQLVLSGMVDRRDAIKMGKLLGIDYFVFGEISKLKIEKNMLLEVPKFLLGYIAYRLTLRSDRVGRAVSDTSAHVKTRLILKFTLMGLDGRDYLVKKYQADFSRMEFDFNEKTGRPNKEKIEQALSRIIDTYGRDLSRYLF